MPSFSAPLHEAGDALRSGDRDSAWTNLQPALNYPHGVEMSDAEFAQSLGILELANEETLSQQTIRALKAARENPADVQSLFAAGFLLLDSDLPLLAATALARANGRAPDIPGLVNALAAALGRAGLHVDAYLALQDAYGARQQDWQSRYAYSHHALLSGQFIEARQSFALQGPPTDEATAASYEQMVTYFDRHRSLSAARPFDETDLRAWHYVLTGGLLSHLSMPRIDDGMHGRYSHLQDSDALIHESVVRGVAILQAWDIRPAALIYSNDRSSEILAHAWHRRIGIPIRPFTSGDVASAGFFVAYDLDRAAADFTDAMKTRRPDQVLLSHASCWTKEAPFTSDIATLQYQSNVAPWDAGRVVIDPVTHVSERFDTADEGPADVIAERIVATEVPAEALADLADLTALAELVGPPASTGQRDPFYFGSPVQSSRFS